MSKGIIAIDADGVMLDYNLAFKNIYKLAYGQDLKMTDPNAYHATNMWGLPKLEKETLSEFYKQSHKHEMWKKMPAISDAVKAVNSLAKMGYEIVCVTSMPTEYESHRLENLQSLGFPINRVIATSRVGKENPKRKAIEELKPVYFIDDLQKNFEGITGDTKLVLIDRNHTDNPNKDHAHIPHHLSFSSLEGFVYYLLEKSLKEKVDYSWDNWVSGDDTTIPTIKNNK